MKLLSLSEFINENYKIDYKNPLILEGGAFGHMSHPFEDLSLTFGEIKNMIEMSLAGQLDKEILPEEKLDGLALAVSWKDGKLVAARNKGDRRDFGKNALTVKGVIDKFSNHSKELSNAFSFAVRDLEKALSKLNNKKLSEIFDEGRFFMHLEILYPDHPNVIEYGVSKLVFHTVTEYDEDGNPIHELPEKARELEQVIIKVNAHIQKTFEVIPPVAIKLPKHIDFSEKQRYFINKVNKMQSEAKLKDVDEIGKYAESKFRELIDTKDVDSEASEILLTGLINRWVNGIKTYSVRDIKKEIQNPKFLKWVLDFDKKGATKFYKDSMYVLEILFLELGTTILKNASGFLSANPDKSVQKIKDDLDNAVKQIEASGDVTKLSQLQYHMAKIDAIGGFDSIVPTEGIVFVYNGKRYKFTGAFAPVNRITGLLKF